MSYKYVVLQIMSLSREDQICAICSETLSNRYNLKRHFTLHHPKENVRVKGQQTISFGRQKRKLNDEGNAETALDATLLNQASATSTLSDISTLVTHDKPAETKYAEPKTQIELIQGIQESLDKLKDISNVETNSCSSKIEKVNTIEVDKDNHISNVIQKIINSRCLKDFDKHLSDEFFIDQSNERLVCNLCVEVRSLDVMHTSSTSGIFKTSGVEMDLPGQIMSRELRYLRERVEMHLKSDIHTCN